MTADERERLEQRVLLVAPTAKDAELTLAMLGRTGIPCLRCADLKRVCEELALGASALVLPEEVLAQEESEPLSDWVERQPSWSDLPVLVTARPGADSTVIARAMSLLGNVTVLERPMRVSALVSAVRTALRARQRQYQIREQLLEREQAAEILRERVEEMQTLMDTLPVGVFIAHDPACRRITGNRMATAMLRMPVSANLSMSAPAEELPRHFRATRNGLPIDPADLPVQRAARGEPIRNEPVDISFDDGTTIRTVISATPVYAPNGALRGSVGAILDITEQKRVEEALQQADRRKDEFLAILGHELRNPLAPIRNALHVLRLTNENDSDAERMGEMLERQVNNMVRLVDDLLEVSRITRGKIELKKERIELETVIRNAVETSRPLIKAGGHELQLALPPESLVLEGDPLRLTQVFANLLNNAAKYTLPGGRISLGVSSEGDQVTVSVRDSGRGIPAELLPSVFELFTQVDRHTNDSGGLGIGLTIVKTLVEMHGGTVRAHSEGAGHGSEFVVRLPLVHGVASATEQRSRAHDASALTQRRVLVVDDNRDAAESLGMLLELLGAEVHVVFSGGQALEALPAYKPSVVLLDLGMPGLDGYEVARRIRKLPEFDTVVLIALTGWGQAEDRRRTREAGFDHHLIKPTDIHALETLLASLETKENAEQ